MVNTCLNGGGDLLTATGWDKGDFMLLDQEMKTRRDITSAGICLPPSFIV